MMTSRTTATRFRHMTLAAVLLAAVATVPSPAAASAGCASGADAEALHLRAFQNRLMVAALSCGMEDRYNAFIEKFDGVLGASGNTMRRWFDRSYGASGKREMNAHVTRLANNASVDSFEDRRGFCRDATEKLDHAMSLGEDELRRFSTEAAAAYAGTSRVCFAGAGG